MYRKTLCLLATLGLMFCLTACHSHHEKHSRSVTFEGPEKKTEVKVETTKKHPD